MKPDPNNRVDKAAEAMRARVTEGVDLSKGFRPLPRSAGDKGPHRYAGPNGVRVDLFCNGVRIVAPNGTRAAAFGDGALKTALEAIQAPQDAPQKEIAP